MDTGHEALRRKVERGEVLTPPELSELEAAGASSPEGQLAVVHALLNADQVAPALARLLPLRRDFPRRKDVQLAFARVLILKEDWGQAEGLLKEAFAQDPADPEVMKALAVLAMRRHEFVLARKLVADARRADPLDDEARVLEAELEAAGEQAPLPPAAPVTLEGFATALEAALKAEGLSPARRGDQLFLPGRTRRLARLLLQPLHADFLREQRPLQPFVEEFARHLAEESRAVGTDRAALLGALRPVLRETGFEFQARGAARRALGEGLQLFYVLDHPTLVRYVPEGMGRSLGLDAAGLHARALLNLEGAPWALTPVRRTEAGFTPSPGVTGLYSLWHGDGYDGARLLVPAVRARLRERCGPGALRVWLGARELVVVAAGGEASHLARAPVLDGIAGDWRLTDDGRLVPWT
jgi:hypothetical protein